MNITWYFARAAGLCAWAILTASVLWGLALSSRFLGRRPRANWLLDMHRYLGGLAAIFTGLHVVAIMLDTYVHFSLAAVVVPFASTWRPGAVAWGVVSLYLLVAVELTSLARSRLPKKLWRAVHVSAFPLFLMSTVHAITAGTDGRTWLFEGVATASILVVSALTGLRVSQQLAKADAPARVPAAARAAVLATRTPTSV